MNNTTNVSEIKAIKLTLNEHHTTITNFGVTQSQSLQTVNAKTDISLLNTAITGVNK